jgi:stalled ribosome rescue protein Dom34
MKNSVIWLDSENAHIFDLKVTGIERTFVKKNGKDHHTRHKNDLHKDVHSEQYYNDLTDKIKDVDQLLLMGPGLAKKHFKEYLGAHQPNTLAKKIIGLESIQSFEHLSEKQMLAKVRKFFKSFDLFH